MRKGGPESIIHPRVALDVAIGVGGVPTPQHHKGDANSAMLDNEDIILSTEYRGRSARVTAMAHGTSSPARRDVGDLIGRSPTGRRRRTGLQAGVGRPASDDSLW